MSGFFSEDLPKIVGIGSESFKPHTVEWWKRCQVLFEEVLMVTFRFFQHFDPPYLGDDSSRLQGTDCEIL